MSDSLNIEIERLKNQTQAANLPPILQEKVANMLEEMERASSGNNFFETAERTRHYVDWVTRIPWGKFAPMNLDMAEAKQVLDSHHHGLEDVKARIMEFIAVVKLAESKGQDSGVRPPTLLLVGQAGTGKTTFAKSVADVLKRPLARIPFGGLGSARDLRGQSRLHLEAEPGLVIKALVNAGISNPVILLDEIDRVTTENRADVMGVLLELLDPEQNSAYLDHYVDVPYDLSKVVFVATCNNYGNIATAVMDRLEPLMMPSYNDQEKLVIGKSYVLPRALSDAGLDSNQLIIGDELWLQLIRPLGYDSGIRTLQRTLAGVVRKVARQIVETNVASVTITKENVKDYLPSYRTELL